MRSIARRLGVLTSFLVLGVVAAAGFIAGVQVQKRQVTTNQVATAATGGAGAATGFGGGGARAGGATSTTVAGETPAAGTPTTVAGTGGAPGGAGGTAATGRVPGGTGGPAAGGAGAGGGARGAAGAATAGQVKLVDGVNIYVTDVQANVVKVVTTATSRFTKAGAASTIADVRTGDMVIVQGQKGDDGVVTATLIVNSGAAAGN